MKFRFAVTLAIVAISAACASLMSQGCGASIPTVTQVEAGVAVSNEVCQLIEGIDDTNIVRTVCATVDEIASVIEFILLLRQANDAGTDPLAACATLSTGRKSLCVTKPEVGKAVLFVARARAARLSLDAGLSK